ncbi:Methyltransferase domain-containing protein [bacterium A37T11]|nr:Methyltransferase domain-containing protein [bacterium A37T11]
MPFHGFFNFSFITIINEKATFGWRQKPFNECDMKNSWLARWDDRYSKAEYAFGVVPNEYLKTQLEYVAPGKALFAAEGEGRNAVYAATKGWDVCAFDISPEGKKKAVTLAGLHHVSIDYQVGELTHLAYHADQFDALVLIYAHFPAPIKSAYHKILLKLLCKGGIIIFEAFSKNHLPYRLKNEKVGGPSDLESLFSIEELQEDFAGCHFLTMEEKVIYLNEGLYHNGKGSVIRFVAQKIEE